MSIPVQSSHSKCDLLRNSRTSRMQEVQANRRKNFIFVLILGLLFFYIWMILSWHGETSHNFSSEPTYLALFPDSGSYVLDNATDTISAWSFPLAKSHLEETTSQNSLVETTDPPEPAHSTEPFTKFHEFFAESQEFQQKFLRYCSPDTPVFGALLSNGKPHLNGFGSVLNNALNPYVVGVYPTVNRTYRIFSGNWVYTTLPTFFNDFAQNSSCPLFGNNSVHLKEKFVLRLNETTQSVSFFGHNMTVLYQSLRSSEWGQTWNAIRAIERWNGKDFVFKRKAEILKAIWNPNLELMTVLEDLWVKVIDSNETYFGVHLRRGDKITSGEMKDIPVEKYYNKLMQLCHSSESRGDGCPKNVFLVSDDHSASRKFISLSSARFKVFTLADLVALSGRNVSEFVDQTVRSSTGQLVARDRKDGTNLMQIHTMDLILSITLLALADEVVCTFSSNLGRMVALLKNDYGFQRVHSMDSNWHPL